MGLTSKFLVDTSNFEEITEKLRTVESLPEHIDTEYLEQLGYTNPPDFLVLNFFKDLKFLNDDDTPTPLFEKFRNPETSKDALAYGVIEAYGDLFETDPSIHHKSTEDIVEVLKSLLKDKKSDLILKYMANTVSVLVDYIGRKKIESVLNRETSNTSNIEAIVQEIAEKYSNNQSNLEEDHIVSSEKDSNQVQKVEQAVSANSSASADDESAHDINETVDIMNEQETASENNKVSKDTESPPLTVVNQENGTEEQVDETSEEPEPIPLEESSPPSSDEENNIQSTSNSNTDTEYINKAYIKKAELLYKLDKYDEALPALDKVYQRFSDSDQDELYEHASIALIKKMHIAEELGLNKKLIPIYDNIIERLSSSDNSTFTKPVDRAYINKAEILLNNNQNEKALGAIDQAIKRFKNTQRNNDFLIQAMFKKAELLEQSGADQKALEAYEAFLDTFG